MMATSDSAHVTGVIIQFYSPGPSNQRCTNLFKARLVMVVPSCQRSLSHDCLLPLSLILNPLHPNGKDACNNGTGGSDAASDCRTETSSCKEGKRHQPWSSNVVIVPPLGALSFNHTTPMQGWRQQARQWMVVSSWLLLATMVAAATAKVTEMVTATAKGWGDTTIMAKQKLGGLRPAITGNKKLYSKDNNDSNTENKVCK
jgi:hypothetical protein